MPPMPLTDRMMDVAKLVAEGWTNKQIAAQLRITPRRVMVLITAAVVRLELIGRDDRVSLALWYHEQRQRPDAA